MADDISMTFPGYFPKLLINTSRNDNHGLSIGCGLWIFQVAGTTFGRDDLKLKSITNGIKSDVPFHLLEERNKSKGRNINLLINV
jgi:hypothetical protein